MAIQVRNLVKRFGAFSALQEVSLDIASGELVALLGPSGSGKTTLLRVIAGLETPDSGDVLFDGEDAIRRDVRERGVGFVFQHYALFRHMTVFENVAFGLRVQPRKIRPPEDEIRARVHELLGLVQLDWLGHRYPAQLSGGQRQRIALARALAVKPDLLLLDEPFGALDARVRKELRRWLRRLHDDIHITSVFVTHDQDEALEVADRVVVMNEGAIEQVGTPEEVYDHPATPFVYSFLGDVNLFHGRFEAGHVQIGESSVRAHPGGSVEEGEAMAFVRTHEFEVVRERIGNGALPATVRHIRALGPRVRIELDRTDDGKMIEAEVSRAEYDALDLRKGDQVFVSARRARVFVNSD
ncbi:MAG: sulfate ABC transporter ATP-binding protein [Gemmatimonadales bacterium]|nr:sulfate ABC transporter ATP-binding protein [Gemmatimonadales bacterium]